eukprot:365535-Chlamydomonas_euryale.AAC.53
MLRVLVWRDVVWLCGSGEQSCKHDRDASMPMIPGGVRHASCTLLPACTLYSRQPEHRRPLRLFDDGLTYSSF